jgi:hypothetical protein
MTAIGPLIARPVVPPETWLPLSILSETTFVPVVVSEMPVVYPLI